MLNYLIFEAFKLSLNG